MVIKDSILIEQTSKWWKGWIGASFLLCTLGLIAGTHFFTQKPYTDFSGYFSTASFAAALIGFVGVLFSGLMAWWHHG
jgi:hypothetical protein